MSDGEVDDGVCFAEAGRVHFDGWQLVALKDDMHVIP